MTDREIRRRLALASVVFVCALTLAASYGIVSDVDGERQRARLTPVARAPARPAAGVPAPREPTTLASARAPAPGLVAGPAPRKRVVVVRRTRAS